MKRLFSIFVLALASHALPASAQTMHYVPSDTPAAGPCHPVPFDTGDMRFQCWVRNTAVHPQLGTPVRITDLAFSPCATGRFSAVYCEIRMSGSSLTRLAGCFANNTTAPILVYRGRLDWDTMQDTWSPIGLQFPYLTRGWEHLVVEVRYRGGTVAMPVRSDSSLTRIYNDVATDPFAAQCASTGPETWGPKMRLTLDRRGPELHVAPHAHIGLFERFELRNASPGQGFQLIASLGQGVMQIGRCKLNLALDPITTYSIGPGAPFFNGYAGVVDGFGEATSYFWVPRDPTLLGLPVYHAAVTYDGTGITGCTNTAGLTLIP